MHGDQLALQMGRQLRDLEPVLGGDALDLVRVGLALGRSLEVEQALIPARDLDALEAEPGGPGGDGFQVVERRRITGELRQEYGRPFDRPHRASSSERRNSTPKGGPSQIRDATRTGCTFSIWSRPCGIPFPGRRPMPVWKR